jgi:FkbM family methyltransferase
MLIDSFYNKNKKELNVFCEVGVHNWEFCRLHDPIKDNKVVILVEPLPACFKSIEINVKDKNNVILYNCAVADFDGQTTIYNEGQSAFIKEIRGKAPCHQNGYFDVVGGRQIQQNEIINVKTSLFRHIDPGNIDVLLVDTEGCEYFVLKHLISRPVVIAVETHYRNYKNPYMKEISDWMALNKYRIWYKTISDTYYIRDYVKDKKKSLPFIFLKPKR